ncbi:hypothetical protein [Microbacterium oleivorans]|uniref:Pentapeptide repeat-containing protein n=1 Tax=Microbacterium oleivorans TaxID=273677 RepID=A0A4R5YKY1_9MICO|nr:hypothetical protein [Microbacterium oleivorans]TDL45231.1 hypothetical protein E2R54_01810 [Microbacterium oleivorans]
MTNGTDPEPPKIKYPRTSSFIGMAIAFVVISALGIAFVPERLLTMWVPNASVADRGKLLGPAAQVVLFSLGGLIALVGVVLSAARHGEELRAAERDLRRSMLQERAHELEKIKENSRATEAEQARIASVERDLRARFVTAVELLSSEDDPLRRASGVFVLGSLADDWSELGRLEEVQVCIDLLCGYLCAPLPVGVTSTPGPERPVRSAGYALLRSHLVPGSEHPWDGRKFNLSNAHIDFDVNLTGIVLRAGSTLDLTDATINGASLRMSNVAVDGSARLILIRVKLTGAAALELDGARATAGAAIDLDRLKASEGSAMSLRGAIATQSSLISMRWAVFKGASRLDMHGAVYAQSSVLVGRDITLDTESTVSLEHLQILSGASGDLSDAIVQNASRLSATSALVGGQHSYATFDGAQAGASSTFTLHGMRVVDRGSVSALRTEEVDDGVVELTGVDVDGGTFEEEAPLRE